MNLQLKYSFLIWWDIHLCFGIVFHRVIILCSNTFINQILTCSLAGCQHTTATKLQLAIFKSAWQSNDDRRTVWKDCILQVCGKNYLLWCLDGKNASPGSVQMEPNASQGRKWLFTWAGALAIERLLALQEMKSSFHLSCKDTGQYSG